MPVETVEEGGSRLSLFSNFSFKKEKREQIFLGGHFYLVAISLGRVVVTSSKIVINIPRPIESFTVKENLNGLARSFSSHRQKQILLLLFGDFKYFINLFWKDQN